MSLILHHYEMSPFSEKVRAMLGYLEQDWESVLTSPMPPRPELEPLTGGYRRIPVAQHGADVFCDTTLICDWLSWQASAPELSVFRCAPEIATLSREIEGHFFFVCAFYASSSLKVPGLLLSQLGLKGTFSFLRDRVNVGRRAKVKVTPNNTAAELRAFLAPLEARLLKQAFLFGERPVLADFSLYACLWFVAEVAGRRRFLRPLSALDQWLQRMQAFGHGQRTEISAGEALQQAARATPDNLASLAPSAEQTAVFASLIGQSVRVQPADYARDPATGCLIFASEERFILQRKPDSLGTLHTHLPRTGYQCQPL